MMCPLPNPRSDRGAAPEFLSRGRRYGRAGAVERRDGDRVRDSQLATVLAFALTLGCCSCLPKIPGALLMLAVLAMSLVWCWD